MAPAPAEEEGEAYDKNLVSKHELTQDAALQKLYGDYEKGIVKKRKMLNFCLTLGHKIMLSTAIWFVISYWMAGLFQYNMINFSLYLHSHFQLLLCVPEDKKKQ